MTSFVGIDQSYSGCAIVYYTPRTVTSETLFSFAPEKAGTGPERLHYVYTTLHEHFVMLRDLAGDVGRICYEGYSYGSKFRREELGELGGVMKLALISAYRPSVLHVVAPTAVKKYATGSGRADKDRMLLAVYKRWGYEASSHDAADAYTLAHIAAALDADEPPETTFQTEVLNSIRNPKRSRAKKSA
ncbi:crossover junction endodeoxyribonuclease RuvC [Streptomyces malaysiensis]|uniref:Holliday junction resolvasome, endonuclease subunit n=1 Tax=Streptomyces malaysiensis TaxID=92644 RepID=A0A7X6AZ38_STRMQ|nr:crossover junction endodeoxyribonuclease RuvC [Streptomyces malaysiensis]NIY68019.1 holliday junction resolvasome, endonuclease subunit [Streptomyces malaysiensis]